MHRIPASCNRSGLFQKRLPDVRNGRSEQLRLLFLGSTKNKIDQAFGHSRGQVGNIDRLLPLNMLLNEIIDFAVQAALRCTFVLRDDLTLTMSLSSSISPC